MPQVIDRPTFIPLEEDLLEGFGGFPNSLHLISVGDGKYAANNASLPDGQQVNGLACFLTETDAILYMGQLNGLSGDVVDKTFDEARQIAISKPVLSCLFLFGDGKIQDVHWVR